MTASSSGMYSYTSTAFTITTYVNSMTISTSNSSPSVNFSFTLTVTLYAVDGTLYAGAVSVTLSGTGLAGTTTGANNAGTIQYSVYMTQSGSYTITATAPASTPFPVVTATIAETVKANLVKITSFAPLVIDM